MQFNFSIQILNLLYPELSSWFADYQSLLPTALDLMWSPAITRMVVAIAALMKGATILPQRQCKQA